jgi:hypothetical protein
MFHWLNEKGKTGANQAWWIVVIIIVIVLIKHL